MKIEETDKTKNNETLHTLPSQKSGTEIRVTEVSKHESTSTISKLKNYDEIGLAEVRSLLQMPVKQRKKRQTARLMKYLQGVKVFSELISKNETETYENISQMIKLQSMPANETIFLEGDEGNLFYIILDGEVEILKSNKMSVQYERHSDEDKTRLNRRKAFLDVFQANYDLIFWPGLEISKKHFDDMLGLKAR